MEGDILNTYKIYFSRTNLYIFVNLENIKSPEEFYTNNFVKSILMRENLPLQKIWNFLALNPVLEAWYKKNIIISDFLVGLKKYRKTYTEEHYELFVNERIIPLGILPSTIFEFLGLETSQDIKIWDINAKQNIENLNNCKICGRNTFPSEIVEPISNKEGICYYCIEDLKPEDRKKIETPKLFRKRIEETWIAIPQKQREQIIFNILRETRKPMKIDDVYTIKIISKKLSNQDNILKTKDLTPLELEKLVKKLDDDYFITWWEKVK